MNLSLENDCHRKNCQNSKNKCSPGDFQSSEETLNSTIVFTLQQGQEAISQLQSLLSDPTLQEEVYQTEIQNALTLAKSSYDALIGLQNVSDLDQIQYVSYMISC